MISATASIRRRSRWLAIGVAVVVTAVSLLLNYAGLAARWADGYVAIVMALTGYFLVRLPSLWVEVGWMRTPPTTDRTAFAAFSTMTLIPTITVGAGVGVSYGLLQGEAAHQIPWRRREDVRRRLGCRPQPQ